MNAVALQEKAERDTFYRVVGEAIRAAREAAGLSRESLAREAFGKASDAPTIYNAEMRGTCTLHTLHRIAYALDTTLDALVPVDADDVMRVGS